MAIEEERYLCEAAETTQSRGIKIIFFFFHKYKRLIYDLDLELAARQKSVGGALYSKKTMDGRV